MRTRGLTAVEVGIAAGVILLLLWASSGFVRELLDESTGLALNEMKTFIEDGDLVALEGALDAMPTEDTRLFDGDTLLHVGAKSTDANALRLLLDHGDDVNARNRREQTPLHVALGESHFGVSHDDQMSMITLLLENGADVNALMEGGESPLYLAARRQEPSFVKLLLSHGADVNIRIENRGKPTPRTPLAAACSAGAYGTVLMLLQAGAKVNVENPLAESSPLRWAIRSTSIVKLLIEHGADVTAGETRGALTALHVAATSAGLFETVKLLLDHGAAPGPVLSATGETPLHAAARRGASNIVELLLEVGAPHNVVSAASGMTPSEVAKIHGHAQLADVIANHVGPATVDE